MFYKFELGILDFSTFYSFNNLAINHLEEVNSLHKKSRRYFSPDLRVSDLHKDSLLSNKVSFYDCISCISSEQTNKIRPICPLSAQKSTSCICFHEWHYLHVVFFHYLWNLHGDLQTGLNIPLLLLSSCFSIQCFYEEGTYIPA